jgi:phytoene dehydrogenase-like protein
MIKCQDHRMEEHDAVVIGGGHNGLVTAIALAGAGWDVAVVEQGPRLGGAVWSGELTVPGFVHDGHSTNHNLFLGSPFFARHGDELARHGLRYAVSATPFANAFGDGRSLRVVQDVEATIDGLDPADRPGWRALDALFDRIGPSLFGLFGAPPPGASTLPTTAPLARQLLADRRNLGDLARLLMATPRAFADAHLVTDEAKAALACWGLHIDFGPDVAGGAMFAFLEAFSDQRNGMAIVEGGAGRMIDAMAAMLAARGGQVRTHARAARIEVRGGRAETVVLDDGERLRARRAVIASVTPSALAELVTPPTPALRDQARRFRYGPATMMVHLALDGPVPWQADGLADAAYVHVTPSVDALARTYTAAVTGSLPAEPLLVVGQTSVVDPTRSPDGQHVVWIQVRTLPPRPTSDEACELDVGPGDWAALAEPYADRVMALLERVAPGAGARVLGRTVLSPADLERSNPNLVGGDSLGGSMHLSQSFVLRPRTWTGVDGLWLTGTATWPGAGISALPGDHTAAAVLAAERRPLRGLRDRARGRR